ncbi:AbrB family transcriptional regulator [Rhodoblastus sphagnicola]|uniref:AbrB family transcriptional regulator n=2 Tax=Rhodoblastus sphagnicola TaxID=333368 RepID=A0A2S6MZL8_9HYPH|nr:AbrB/MazE/SpoVT family DNA-binding domain-containing protein [Rhodoblastus sphagnicola]PPQ27824.1 AbrB family transcriptional regulator [Rhodoblastus sphagnicola]
MQVAKWGNSLAVRLPKKLVDQLHLKAGDEIDIVEAAREKLVVDKLDRRAEALARMKARAWETPANYHFDRDEANQR